MSGAEYVCHRCAVKLVRYETTKNQMNGSDSNQAGVPCGLHVPGIRNVILANPADEVMLMVLVMWRT
jgi:phage-related baseplate assembly protein